MIPENIYLEPKIVAPYARSNEDCIWGNIIITSVGEDELYESRLTCRKSVDTYGSTLRITPKMKRKKRLHIRPYMELVDTVFYVLYFYIVIMMFDEF